MAFKYTDKGSTTLASTASSGATSLAVASVSGMPSISAGDSFTIQIDPTGTPENAKVTGVSGTTLTLSAALGATHASGQTVTFSIITSADLDQIKLDALSAYGQLIEPQGRLTGVTGNPIGSTASSTSVYYTPFKGNVVSLWDGYCWKPLLFGQLTLALGTVVTTAPYDIFLYISGGAVAIEKLVWTDYTTRATGLTWVGGRLCKTGDQTRLYAGTIYCSTTTTVTDNDGARCIWNQYNRIRRNLTVTDSASSWSYQSSTIRQANANSANAFTVVVGWDTEPVSANIIAPIFGGGDSGYQYALVGVGVDAVSTSGIQSAVYIPPGEGVSVCMAEWSGLLGVGAHTLYWCERGALGTSSFFGTQGNVVAGMYGEIYS